ncbi:MAG: DUF4331 domain-containing protein [Acidobacteria bacterium]|nr:DUF4331 domain-containing protein [Acidobacteriota bacterium]MCA1609340.1 DUF4331 domain-containing protein [Acidobacteriota bacterium]
MRFPRFKNPGSVWAPALLALMIGSLSTNLLASSHREAPGTSVDPLIDATDLYAFRDPNYPSNIVMIANYIPGEEPAGGPNFYHFGENIRYEIKIDNNGDGIEDITYRFTFKRNVRRGDTYTYNDGPIEGVNAKAWGSDPNLIVYNTYSVDKIIGFSPQSTQITRIGTDLLELPNNVGPRSFPDGYDTATGAGGGVYTMDNNVQVFVGPRRDPFFVDLGMIFDLVNYRPGTLPGDHGGGIDTLAGFNVHTIAISVPIEQLTQTGTVITNISDPRSIIGVWTTASRPASRLLNSDGTRTETGAYVQVSRLGQPLINELVVPRAAKDLFNASFPNQDAQFAAGVLDPEVPKLLKALLNVNSPSAPRNDLLNLVQGFPGLTRRPNETIADELRLNTSIYPTPKAIASRLGLLASDIGGYPNGRRLGDDVVDITLRVFAGVLVNGFNIAPNNALGDGVDGPDAAFLTGFPYVGRPNSGYDHKHDNPTLFPNSFVEADPE